MRKPRSAAPAALQVSASQIWQFGPTSCFGSLIAFSHTTPKWWRDMRRQQANLHISLLQLKVQAKWILWCCESVLHLGSASSWPSKPAAHPVRMASWPLLNSQAWKRSSCQISLSLLLLMSSQTLGTISHWRIDNRSRNKHQTRKVASSFCSSVCLPTIPPASSSCWWVNFRIL